ncbi:MAG: phosphatase PAP2 family protein [Solobacterium sp.]|nr:phosphatase PAP2 family protein [Solobacterium sp.]
MEKNVPAYYEKIPERLKDRFLLYRADRLLTGIVFATYPVLLLYLLLARPQLLFRTVMVPAVSLVLVTLARRLIRRPRPFEQYAMVPLLKKDSGSGSFPSRHAFSAMMIAMCVMQVSLPLGLLYILLAVLIGAVRIIGGVHYLSDVLAGFAAAIVCGIILR